MVLSVKELSRASETTQYFETLQAALGKSQPLQLGQGVVAGAKDVAGMLETLQKQLHRDRTQARGMLQAQPVGLTRPVAGFQQDRQNKLYLGQEL